MVAPGLTEWMTRSPGDDKVPGATSTYLFIVQVHTYSLFKFISFNVQLPVRYILLNVQLTVKTDFN